MTLVASHLEQVRDSCGLSAPVGEVVVSAGTTTLYHRRRQAPSERRPSHIRNLRTQTRFLRTAGAPSRSLAGERIRKKIRTAARSEKLSPAKSPDLILSRSKQFSPRASAGAAALRRDADPRPPPPRPVENSTPSADRQSVSTHGRPGARRTHRPEPAGLTIAGIALTALIRFAFSPLSTDWLSVDVVSGVVDLARSWRPVAPGPATCTKTVH